MPHTEPEPADYRSEHIRDALARDPRVSELDVQVTIAGGDVFLTGHVPTRERRDVISRVVRDLEPDATVHNDVSVGEFSEPSDQEVLS